MTLDPTTALKDKIYHYAMKTILHLSMSPGVSLNLQAKQEGEFSAKGTLLLCHWYAMPG